jgi:hypothetical protein
MYTKLSADNFIIETLSNLRLSANLFWAYSGGSVGKTSIERCLNGTRELDSRTEAPQLLELARELRKLQEDYPVPIDWREVRTIKTILQHRREMAQVQKQ